MKLKTKLSKLRHDGHITDAEYAIIINVLNKFSTQPPKTQQKVEQPCEDAISRAEALRIAKSYYHAEYVVDKIRQLPPVIPKTKPCEDCISREEAIRVAEQGQIQGYEWQFKKLCNLPSVTPWTGWTPASQHPEPDTAVLLTVRYKSSGQWTYQIGYWEDALEKWEKWLEIGTLDDEFEILAWMELPEGYKEDKHE